MILEEHHVRPFDRTYEKVTRRILERAGALSPPASDWLLRLVDAFAQERHSWNSRRELAGYRIRWMRFRSKLLRLVAGAYLHIAYDLPRAMADEWPESGSWQAGPNVTEGRDIYFRLRDIFPETFSDAARDARILGMPAILLRGASDRAIRSATVWVENLRQGAWIHAEILSTAPDRSYREQKMAEAMTAALEDATWWAPWSILDLRPPYDAFYSAAWVVAATELLLVLDVLLRVVALAIVGGWVLTRGRKAGAHLAASARFIDMWGFLTFDYVAMAVRHPEEFDDHRRGRRAELGLGLDPRGFRA